MRGPVCNAIWVISHNRIKQGTLRGHMCNAIWVISHNRFKQGAIGGPMCKATWVRNFHHGITGKAISLEKGGLGRNAIGKCGYVPNKGGSIGIRVTGVM